MTDTPAIVEAKIRAGYRPPTENPLVCRNCGASGYNPTPYRHRYRLRYIRMATCLPSNTTYRSSFSASLAPCRPS